MRDWHLVCVIGLQIDDATGASGQPCSRGHAQDFAKYLVSDACLQQNFAQCSRQSLSFIL